MKVLANQAEHKTPRVNGCAAHSRRSQASLIGAESVEGDTYGLNKEPRGLY